jgi:hypothetical protein
MIQLLLKKANTCQLNLLIAHKIGAVREELSFQY